MNFSIQPVSSHPFHKSKPLLFFIFLFWPPIFKIYNNHSRSSAQVRAREINPKLGHHHVNIFTRLRGRRMVDSWWLHARLPIFFLDISVESSHISSPTERNSLIHRFDLLARSITSQVSKPRSPLFASTSLLPRSGFSAALSLLAKKRNKKKNRGQDYLNPNYSRPRMKNKTNRFFE